MPKPSREFRVLHDFTFVPRPSVVQTYKAGAIVRGLTRECVQAGLAENALQPLTANKGASTDGETDDL